MMSWASKPTFSGAIVGDATYCAKLIAKQVGTDGDFQPIRSVVKSWCDNDVLLKELQRSDFARENVRDVVGFLRDCKSDCVIAYH